MNNVTEYPKIKRRFPEFATDIVHFRQRPHPEFPELPCAEYYVSRADMDQNTILIPLRTKEGRKHSAIWDNLPQKQADAYAKRHGWPFRVHRSNLAPEVAEEVTPTATTSGEANILHETANLYLFRTPSGTLEIRLNGNTHAVVVGTPPSVERAKTTMERLERYPEKLRQFMNHH